LSPRNLTFPFKLFKGLVDSWSLVGEFDPDVVVGTGGYVSGPVLWTAGLRGRPTLIQEQNAYAGVTNRLLAKRASRIHLAFPEAKKYCPEDKCVISGNPVRDALRSVDRPASRRHFRLSDDADVIFVFGGSLGSVPLNEAVLSSLDAILRRPGRHVIWQTGSKHFDTLHKVVEHERVHLLPYVDRMDLAYGAADVVVSRAGAITCSELMVTGTPAVLVPSPAVAEDHQTKNARSLAEREAAVFLPQAELSQLPDLLQELLDNPDRLETMRANLLAMAKPDAARSIASDVLSLAGGAR
jgi:UDP-N-acetylglucosamine--N-acetylmuramyl-(pentapeptide) pyrophosphoryl-undecaprenol N-acetylglucosamine transferase